MDSVKLDPLYRTFTNSKGFSTARRMIIKKVWDWNKLYGQIQFWPVPQQSAW